MNTRKLNFEYNEKVKFHPIAGEEFAITIKPNPNLFSQSNPVKQHKAILACLYRRMSQTCDKLHLWVELTQAGNIHYHGLCIIKDIVLFFAKLKSFVDNVGFITMKPFTPKDGKDGKEIWIEYMGKTQTMMEAMLQCSFPLTLNDWLIQAEKDKNEALKKKLSAGHIRQYIKTYCPEQSDSD